MHDVVVTAVSAAVSAATIILASMSKILFLSISLIENWKFFVPAEIADIADILILTKTQKTPLQY